jgi:cyclopropane fatty-acyl-phospholipid synthase-like methyltransferase
MPYSHNSNIDYVKKILQKHNPRTILDIGAGAGKYAKLKQEVLPNSIITGIEIWKPYIKEFDLNNLYDNLIIDDIRNIDNFNYDMVILGDVLEHMTKEEAKLIWEKILTQAKTAIISIPICYMPQGHVHGNPYEEHIKDDWSHEEVLETFNGITSHMIFEETATYLARFRVV